MRIMLLAFAMAVGAIQATTQAQQSHSDLRAQPAAYQMSDRSIQDSAAIVAAIESLAAKFDRLQIQVNSQASDPCASGVSQAIFSGQTLFDGQGRQILFDSQGRQVLLDQNECHTVRSPRIVGHDASAIIDQFCPGCSTQQLQAHNFTSTRTHSPTSFDNIPMIDSNNNMANAIPRVIMVEGRPQLILDPEPVSFLQKYLSWRRR